MARILSFEAFLLRDRMERLEPADRTPSPFDRRPDAIVLTVTQISHRSTMLAHLEHIRASEIAHESSRH